MGKNLWLRAKTKANLKLEPKIKVAWSTCDKKREDDIYSTYETYSKDSLWNL